MTSILLNGIAKEWSSLVQKTAYLYLPSSAFCKHANIRSSSDNLSVSHSSCIDLRSRSVVVLKHSAAFLKHYVNYLDESNKAWEISEDEEMAVKVQVQNVDLDLDLDAS